jgi:hypothetical protein
MAIDRNPKNSKVRNGAKGIIWNTGEGASWGMPSTPSGGSAAPQNLSTLTATSGTDASPVSGNQITIPAGYNGLAVWAGNSPLSQFALVLHANVGGTTHVIRMRRLGYIIINASSGTVVSFASQQRVKDTYTLSGLAASLMVSPIITPGSLSAPSGSTGTVNCDKNGPGPSNLSGFWAPTAANAHVALVADNSTIQINSAATRREIFIVEHDDADVATPIRHVSVPANTDYRVQCRYKKLSFANYDGSTISITTPAGATIGGTSREYRPAFTVNATGNASNAGELNTELFSAADGEDIVLASGTYNMSGSPITQSGFTVAMTRNVRIRSSSGNPADVTISGAALELVIAQNKQWIFEGITFDLNGITTSFTGLIDTLGNTHFHNCIIKGQAANTPTLRPNVAARGTSAFVTNPIFSFCINETSAEDNYDTDANANLTLIIFGGTVRGNGPGTSDTSSTHQLITSHSGTKIQCWGSVFSDTNAPTAGRLTQIWPDDNAASEIHLLFCRSLSADIAHTEGLVIQAVETMYYNNFEKVRILSPKTSTASGSNGSHCACWIGNRCIKLTTNAATLSAAFWLRFDLDPTSYSYLAGNYFTLDTETTENNALDARRTVESYGNIYECLASSNAIPLRIGIGGPASAQANVICAHDRYIAANALFELGTNANLGVDLINCLFTGSAVNMSVGATGASCSALHCYAERSGAPTNWTTRFITNTNNTFSTTNVTFEADGITPTTAFLSSFPGFEIGEFGHVDATGKPLLLGGTTSGGGVTVGPVERAEIKTGGILFPGLW